MNHLLWIYFGAMLAASAFSGCGSDDTDSPSADSASGFFRALNQISCQNLAQCCDFDGAALQRCEAALGTQQVELQADKYDPVLGQACLDEAQAATSSCDQMTMGMVSSPKCDELSALMTASGATPLGGECDLDRDCEARAGQSVRCEFGTCTGVSRASLGDACNVTCETNGAGQSCSGNGLSDVEQRQCFVNDGTYCGEDMVCVPLAQKGEKCGQCASDLYCSLEGSCLERKADGQMCANGFECLATSVCSEAGVCAALAAEGESCTSGSECQSGACNTEDMVCSSLDDSFGIGLICELIGNGVMMP